MERCKDYLYQNDTDHGSGLLEKEYHVMEVVSRAWRAGYDDISALSSLACQGSLTALERKGTIY